MSVNQSIKSAFLVDSYSLGSHWVYDEDQLKNLPIDWESLNAPQSIWHKGKEAGDLTHYGDHTLWLLEFVKINRDFDVVKYARFWQDKMASYEGYIDGSSRDTLEHLKAGKSPREGVVNHDLSICGRISPLLLISKDLESFVSSSISFAKLTHNDPLVLEAVHFFATLLHGLLDGYSMKLMIENISPNYSQRVVSWIHEGIDSRDKETFSAIRSFGPACGVDGGFAGTIHLITKYDSVEDMMKENAKAGGDSSARGMIAGMILGVLEDKEYALLKKMNAYTKIEDLLYL